MDVLAHRGVIARTGGHLDEARGYYLEALGRLKQVYGISHIQLSPWLGPLFEVLREQRDPVALRDFCEEWLREILALPAELDPYERSRRHIRIDSLLRALATLSEPIPFDAELALRACEANERRTTGTWMMLYRLGRCDESEAEIRKFMRRHPDQLEGWDRIILALVHARRGEMDEAREWYEKARPEVESGEHGQPIPSWLVDEAFGRRRPQGEARSNPIPDSTGTPK
jgi:tetratricopeptide (TPR) repeat protein